MSTIAFMFPGQGAQAAGMGRDFYEQSETAKKVYDRASELLGFSLPELCFEPNNRLDMTEYTQAAMVTTSIAIMKVILEQTSIRPAVSAGLSLGEYCALAASEAISEEDAVRLVRERGILMQQAVPVGIGSMAAVLGMEASRIEEILSGIEAVQIANYNCPGQIVISGKKEGVALAEKRLKEAGARRVVALKVSGPFHSQMLLEAGKKLGQVLEQITVSEPVIPYVANVTARYVTEASQIKELLTKQVYSPVKWQQSVEEMIHHGVDTFIEVGPGKTLSGFVKKISKNVRVLNVGTLSDLEALRN